MLRKIHLGLRRSRQLGEFQGRHPEQRPLSPRVARGVNRDFTD
jgi:hypothetical protein